MCLHIVVQVIILQGIVLFQSLKFYDDEIPCKQLGQSLGYRFTGVGCNRWF